MNSNQKNFTQDPIIIQFRYSGYYQDRAKFARLFLHHSIPYKVAINAYLFGEKVRKNRIRCGVDL